MLKDDAYYIRKVLNGDTNAFGTLVDKYKSMVFTIAFRVVKTEALAEDISQQSFVKAFTKLHNFRMDAKFSSWLYSIVYNTAITHLRKEKNEVVATHTDPAEVSLYDDKNEMLNKELLLQQVHVAIDRLPYEDATLVTLHYFEELSIKEMTRIVNLTESNIKIKLYRARKKLEGLLQKHLEATYI